MRKGLFWAITNGKGEQELLVYAAVCDKNSAVGNGQPEYNSKKGDSYSHERAWAPLTERLPQNIRGKPWNYFPRGRVEIKNGKATVYCNPSLLEWSEFEESVIKNFELEGFPTRFVPDYSAHYTVIKYETE